MAPQYIGGRYYATMYGSDAPAPLWKTYMDAALADTPVAGFSSASTGAQPSIPGNGGSTNASDNNDGGSSGAITETNASIESPTTMIFMKKISPRLKITAVILTLTVLSRR